MSRTYVLSLTAIALLLQACASSGPKISHESPNGTWKTHIKSRTTGALLPHGKMIFKDTKRATYSFHNGRILFYEVSDQGLWKGYWVEDSWGTIQCGEDRDGSNTWGEAIFQFDETYNSYKGTFDSCGDGRKGEWVGKRI